MAKRVPHLPNLTLEGLTDGCHAEAGEVVSVISRDERTVPALVIDVLEEFG